MEFNFIISRWANFYFFVQNLAKWHFSCREPYNVLWQEKLKIKSKKEKEALITFKKIRCRHKESRSILEIAFFTKKDPWKYLKKYISSKEYNQIRDCFSVFIKKFDLLYKEELPKLKKWQKTLQKESNIQKRNNEIDKILSNFLKTPSFRNKAVNVYLLLSTKNLVGGGANINNKSISLEISSYPIEKSNINYVQRVIWHEIVHLLYQKHYLMPSLQKICKNNTEFISTCKEYIVTSLFPNGVIGSKLLGLKIRKQQSLIITKMIQEYIQKNKPIDEKIIQTIVKQVKSKLKNETNPSQKKL